MINCCTFNRNSTLNLLHSKTVFNYTNNLHRIADAQNTGVVTPKYGLTCDPRIFGILSAPTNMQKDAS